MVSGQVPYRDFDMVYTPVSFLATAGVFKILGISVFSGRVLMLFLSTITFAFIFKIIRTFSKSFLIAASGALVYLVWGPGQINFPWPTMFALTFGVLATYFLVRQKNYPEYVFAAGVMGMTAFLSKQNLGAGILIIETSLLFFLGKKRVVNFIFGAVLVFLTWLAYLFSNGGIMAFFQNLYFHTFQKILVEGTISTPFITPSGSLIKTVAKAHFYLLPILASSWAIFIVIQKKQWQIIWIPVLGMTYYLLGIRPVTDYNHFVPLLSLIGLSLTIIIYFTKGKFLKWGVGTLLFGLIILGFHRSLWANYYRWDRPLISQNTFVGDKKVKIWTSLVAAKQIEEIKKHIKENSKKGDKIFVNIYLPMIYFLADRQNATRFDYFSDSATSKSQQKEMVVDLERQRVNLVVGNLLNPNSKSKVNDYIKQNFKKTGEFDTFVVFVRGSLLQ
jgi:hypothetical protein